METVNEEKRIFLYSHSPEAVKKIETNDAIISSGGIRNKNGTMNEQAKPLSFSYEELIEMFSSKNRLNDTDKKISLLVNELSISQKGIKELAQTGWINNIAINQVYTLTYDGFEKTFACLQNLSENIKGLTNYILKNDLKLLEEQTYKYILNLKSDYEKIELPKFDITNSQIDAHLNDIAAFIKRLINDLRGNDENSDIIYKTIHLLVVPFTNTVRKYSVLFLYENEKLPGSFDEWFSLINQIARAPMFINKIQYYINLDTELPFRDKVSIGKKLRKNISLLPKTISFDYEYALYHSKEEYLKMNTNIENKLLTIGSFDGVKEIYL